MASPFRIFRKYAMPMLVVFGVLLMFVFVIGDPLMQYAGGPLAGGGPTGESDRPPRAVAVRWDGGRLTNEQLDNLVLRRRILNAFVRTVEYAGQEASWQAGVEPRPLRVEMIFGPELAEQGVERHLVRTRIFADAARRTGMTISDDAIIRYLEELGRQRVSRDDMRMILARIQRVGSGASTDYIFDALREEMLARNFLVSHQFAMSTVTPEQRWRDWLRVNDRVVVEAAAIPIESFLIDVPEPTDEELAEFFDLYKNREPQPEMIGTMELPSRHPGFRVPRKFDVQYVRADFDQHLDTIEDEITDEEIETYYEENKDLFIIADAGLFGGEDAFDALDFESPDTTATPPADDNQPADEADATDEGDDETQVEQAEPSDDTTGSLAPQHGPFRLAAFLQDADAAGGEADATDVEGDEASDAPTTDTAEADPASDDEPAVEYQPLDEVRDLIRRSLAEQRASERLIQMMAELEAQFRGEFTRHFSARLDAEAQELDPPPPPEMLTDLSAIAAEHGLEHGSTGQLSILELRDSPVGQTRSPDHQEPLWALFLLRSSDLEPYQPISTYDLDNNRYIVMKLSDTPGWVPELDDVRDEVVEAWKRQQAAELAQKHAEELATRIQQLGSTLSDYFEDNDRVQVARTDPFSQLTGGEVMPTTGRAQPFRFSEPYGIVAAGPEFLRRVFELDDNEVAAVLNHDHSIAYIVRIDERQYTLDQLHEAYLAEANTWPGLSTMIQGHMQDVAAQLVNDLLTEAGVEWERDPDVELADE